MRSSRVDTPPLATTGLFVAAHTSRKSSRLGPVRVPSLATSVTIYRAHPSRSRRSMVSKRSPPSFVQPRAASVWPRTSSPTAIRSPNSEMTFAVHSGFSSAAVPKLTRLHPVAKARRRDSSSRIPPDSSTLISTLLITSSSKAALDPIPKAASRSTRWIHCAPAATNSCATSMGNPY